MFKESCGITAKHSVQVDANRNDQHGQLEQVSTSPMFLLNELAASHKLRPIFTCDGVYNKQTRVILQLGEETWSGVGANKKKACCDAALKALQSTNLCSPEKKGKTNKTNMQALTPTVQLNSIMMKQGKAAVYTCINNQDLYVPYGMDPVQVNNYKQAPVPSIFNHTPSFVDSPLQEIQTRHWRPTCLYRMCVTVDGMPFYGVGLCKQAARHHAAQCALDFIKKPDTTDISELPNVRCDNPVKSDVSLLYEKSSANNLSVNYSVVNEEGPSHMKQFIMKVEVGWFDESGKLDVNQKHFVAEAIGNSKKQARKNAAIAVLKEMNDLPFAQTKSKKTTKTFPKSSEKPCKEAVTLHPVSRLVQLMHAQKKKEPTFDVIEEPAPGRKLKFVYQCKADEETVLGQGSNKKEAKCAAAEAMLAKLGLRRNIPDANMQPSKSSLKSISPSDSKPQRVTFSEA